MNRPRRGRSNERMPQHVICHGCGSALLIRDASPPQVTCPRCLARINNPHPYATGPQVGDAPRFRTSVVAPQQTFERSAQPSFAPLGPIDYERRTVFSVDRQLERDTRGMNFALGALAVVLAGGAWISFTILRGAFIGAILACFSVICIAAIVIHTKQAKGEAPGAMGEVVTTLATGCLKVALI